jgi:hypothetical protein
VSGAPSLILAWSFHASCSMITNSGMEIAVVERRLYQSQSRFFSSDDSVDWVEYSMIFGKQCWINASNESIDYAQRIAGAHLRENACYCCFELPIRHRELFTLSTILLLLIDMKLQDSFFLMMHPICLLMAMRTSRSPNFYTMILHNAATNFR